jgi:membrane protein YqaA with SNARE-associated domain
MRASAVLALLGIGAILWMPGSCDLVVFMLATIWCHSPLSPFLPAAFEPVLLIFGRLYSPLLISLMATAGNLYVEYFNYRLYGGMMRLEALERMNGAVGRGRLMRWFEWSPFFAIWFGTVTPIPDWLGRIVASVADYPQGRYLLAFGLGRFPRFLLFASLGAWLSLSSGVIVVVTAGTIAVAATVAVLKWLQIRRARSAAEGLHSRPGTSHPQHIKNHSTHWAGRASGSAPGCTQLGNARPAPVSLPYPCPGFVPNPLCGQWLEPCPRPAEVAPHLLDQ